ncbi:emerin-like [Cynocephalus volans]|uniref:emerin-like n=1 Tax=Cynocephalus volans TaxID=110931 RepID=UPI002FCBD009
MDDCAVVSDPELAALLRYFIPHGNVLGSTDNLLEEEIFKYMTQRRRKLLSSNSSASSYGFSSIQLSKGSLDMYNLPKKEDTLLDQSKGCNDKYYEESYLTTRTSREADSVGTSKGFHQTVTLLADADTFHHQGTPRVRLGQCLPEHRTLPPHFQNLQELPGPVLLSYILILLFFILIFIFLPFMSHPIHHPARKAGP